jgi:hypothetical protein
MNGQGRGQWTSDEPREAPCAALGHADVALGASCTA